VVGILQTQLCDGSGPCCSPVRPPGVIAPLALLRISGKPFTTFGVDVLSIASSPRKTASLAALHDLRLERFTLTAAFVALNAMTAFTQAPACVEVCVSTLAWLTEFVAWRQLTTFNANNETRQPMRALAATCGAL
jgi:hypothetical protein